MKTIIILLISLIAIGLIVPLQAEAKAKFKVEVQICCVNSDSGNAKIKVKLDNGDSKTKTVSLSQLADEQDWDNVSVFFTFKHSPHTFKACVNGFCEKGINGPAKTPEVVQFNTAGGGIG